ncbi:FAS1 domain-containing protein [Parasitella parasitica]|nr:FAS1 domain-containing protein [Parasitella parasitica]
MRIEVILLGLFMHNIFALRSIWEELAISESKTFYNSIVSNLKYHPFQSILQNTATNKTFFIPSENAVQAAIQNNLFSTNTTLDDLLYSILPTVYDIHSLSSSTKRQYVNTLSTNYSVIILSPPTSSKNTQVLAGTTVANITNHTMCSNGIIYYVDQFITAPLNVISTISSLSELNQLENIIKAQNLSNIFTSTANQTIFAPIDAAWNAVNGSSIPFGTIIHDLKYHVVNGTYYQQDLRAKNLTLVTTYSSATIQTEAYAADGRIAVIGGASAIEVDGGDTNQRLTIANIVQSDILTSSGKVIHLIDKILAADPNNVVSLARNSITSNSTRTGKAIDVQKSFSASATICSRFSLAIVMLAVMLCF